VVHKRFKEDTVTVTRVFRSGDSQAIHIPPELAYEDVNQDLSITRQGDVIIIAPVRPSLKQMIAELRAMPKPDEIEVYEPIELPDRE
jgi:antitoxin VapB